MNHQHDFQIVLEEKLANDFIRIHQECDCGATRILDSKTGDWLGRDMKVKEHK